MKCYSHELKNNLRVLGCLSKWIISSTWLSGTFMQCNLVTNALRIEQSAQFLTCIGVLMLINLNFTLVFWTFFIVIGCHYITILIGFLLYNININYFLRELSRVIRTQQASSSLATKASSRRWFSQNPYKSHWRYAIHITMLPRFGKAGEPFITSQLGHNKPLKLFLFQKLARRLGLFQSLYTCYWPPP